MHLAASSRLPARPGIFLTRPSLGHYVATRQELLWRAGDVLGWIASGKLRRKRKRGQTHFPAGGT
jgi:hypothetical protein